MTRTNYYQNPPSPEQGDVPEALISDGFSLPDLDVAGDAPPAYGDLPDQLQFNQAGFEAGAVVTGMEPLELF
jgi:hypothetical protein